MKRKHTETYWEVVKSHLVYILLFVAAVLSMNIFWLLSVKQEYRSEVSLLVVQYGEPDSYVAAKSAERLAKDLSSIIPTTSFFQKVSESGYVDLSELKSLDERSKRKAWEKKITTSIKPETGILTLFAYDTDRQVANDLAAAVAYVLVNDAEDYYGENANVRISIVNTPLTSEHPVRPNWFKNLGFAFFVSLFLAFSYLFLRKEYSFEKSQQPGSPSFFDSHPFEPTSSVQTLHEEKKSAEANLKDWIK